MKPFSSLVISAVLALPLGQGALAQDFPTHPVTLVVPYPPGGSVDSVARVLATELTEQTGKTFVVDNRAGGAGGVVGSTDVQKAAGDGYTLLFNASIFVVTPILNSKTPYNPLTDFATVAGVAEGPLIVSTPVSTKANTLREFFDAVKASPDDYNFATSGYGSAGHLAVEVLKQDAGVDTEVVSYKGGGPALSDLIGGQVQLMADPMMSSLPQVKAGKLKPLAITSAERSPLAPEIPTVAESGMPALALSSWYGVWAPKTLDPKAAAYLTEAMEKVVTSATFGDKLATFGFTPMFKDPAGLQGFAESETARYRDIVAKAGLKTE
ncbi:Bug family tripartite tricarboxylate transporter substrate binding protein [Paenirhodobacter sp.]|uniref:Bug family tripartite tricarboxylate transporter substrate binding protein n=1 Tax=Paenirhodobacter sp. TaxID=1965326 RepID=UPI003B3ECD5D